MLISKVSTNKMCTVVLKSFTEETLFVSFTEKTIFDAKDPYNDLQFHVTYGLQWHWFIEIPIANVTINFIHKAFEC